MFQARAKGQGGPKGALAGACTGGPKGPKAPPKLARGVLGGWGG